MKAVLAEPSGTVMRDVLARSTAAGRSPRGAGPAGRSRRRPSARAARCPAADRRPATLDRPGGGGAQADDGLGDLGLAAAAATGQADDLAGAHLERDGSGRPRSRPGSSTAAAIGRCLPAAAAGHRLDQRARVAGHRGDQLAARQLGDRRGEDVPGVAEDRDRVADLVDLLQVVADEQERDALRLQRRGCGRTAADGGAVELGGRLVEDDEPGAERQRPGDLDELPLLDGQRRRPAASTSTSTDQVVQQLVAPRGAASAQLMQAVPARRAG